MRFLLGGWLIVAGVLLASGQSDLPGLPAMRTASGWWLARQFDAAALADDLEGLARIGPALQRRTGDGVALLFASQRLGFQVTGSSYGLPRVEAEAWGRIGVLMLESELATLENPWDARRIQADIIVNRNSSSALRPLGALAAEQWFAAGGGPDWPMSAPTLAYQTGLELEPEQREAFFLDCLSAFLPTEEE